MAYIAISFEDARTAALAQNGGEAMRADRSRPGELHRLIQWSGGTNSISIAWNRHTGTGTRERTHATGTEVDDNGYGAIDAVG